MRIIIFGPPGAGKGTQAELISSHYGIPHLSTGEIFRSAIKDDTTLGKKIKSKMDSGELVPDRIVVELIAEELEDPKYSGGYILDGFPRTLPQAKAFSELLNSRGLGLDAFLVLDVPEEELIRRILNRREGRSDDTKQAVKNRLSIYIKETAPVFGFYRDRGLVHKIDGVGSIEEIFDRIKSSLA